MKELIIIKQKSTINVYGETISHYHISNDDLDKLLPYFLETKSLGRNLYLSKLPNGSLIQHDSYSGLYFGDLVEYEVFRKNDSNINVGNWKKINPNPFIVIYTNGEEMRLFFDQKIDLSKLFKDGSKINSIGALYVKAIYTSSWELLGKEEFFSISKIFKTKPLFTFLCEVSFSSLNSFLTFCEANYLDCLREEGNLNTYSFDFKLETLLILQYRYIIDAWLSFYKFNKTFYLLVFYFGETYRRAFNGEWDNYCVDDEMIVPVLKFEKNGETIEWKIADELFEKMLNPLSSKFLPIDHLAMQAIGKVM